MENLTPATALLYFAIAAFVIWRVVFRQLRGSTLSLRSLWLIPVILLVIGASATFGALPGASAAEIGLLIADAAVLVALGVLRANSVTVSERDGHAFQKGSGLTLLLWLATIGVRVGFVVLGIHLDAYGALSSGSIWLTVGLSIGVQNAVIYSRARERGLRIAASKGEAARVGR
jgi:hypothetical protein